MAGEVLSVIKCDKCGADMTYSPERSALYCEYCDSIRQIEKHIAPIRDYYRERGEIAVDASCSVYKCPNCGGEVAMENFATATECPFCGATNIVKRENMPGLKPDSILPFSLSRNQAQTAGKKWLKKKIFAPGKLKKSFAPEKFKGVYVPVFDFSSDTSSAYEGRLGEDYTVSYTDSKGNTHTRVETRWFHVSGTLNRIFANLMIEASSRLEQKDLVKISPYDMQAAEEYKREYLAGFSAERYDTTLDGSFEKAKAQMNDEIRSDIIRKYHADRVGYLNVNTVFRIVKFHYIMLPVWICAYKYKEKLYSYVTNGRTGKCTGKTPLSPWRILFAVSLAIGIIALAIWLVFSSGIIT